MNGHLFDRSLGHSGLISLQRYETARQIDAFAARPDILFDGSTHEPSAPVSSRSTDPEKAWGHRTGAQCLVIDQFDGRYMLSGGADASIHLWDLEQPARSNGRLKHKPLGSVERGDPASKFGVTNLSFYPFDAGLFLSSSYDHYLRVYDTNSLEASGAFDLGSVVYSHDISPIASHLLVATASQHPAVRLVDLNSGSSIQSLAGHDGAVFSVAWSPRDEHVLATGGADGTVRLWDIRRSAGCIGLFDLEDSIGINGIDGLGTGARDKQFGRAHVGACNGVVWSEDGDYIVSTGHDERIRVWDVANGANALSHFGPRIANRNLATRLPLIVPRHLTSPHQRVMFYPNEREILMFDLFEGTLLKRLKPPDVAVAQARSDPGQRNIRYRTTDLAWRKGHLELYSSHSDGKIRAWAAPEPEDEREDDESGGATVKEDSVAKKRKALDDIFISLTKKPIRFT